MSELTQELKLQFQNYNQTQLYKAFIDSCEHGHLEVIKYLLTSHLDITKNDWGFVLACQYGHLDVVRYLLTSPELKQHADIHYDNESGFRWACHNGHLDVARYLLTFPELKEHANIHAKNDLGFRWACQYGHLELVRYLLTSPELKEHANIHANDDGGFRWACENGDLNMVRYLLTFFGEYYIEFQKTEYNLEWAMSEKQDEVVKAMTISLYKNDRFNYLENISKVEKYCQEHNLNFEKWLEEMVKNDVDINSHTTELFV